MNQVKLVPTDNGVIIAGDLNRYSVVSLTDKIMAPLLKKSQLTLDLSQVDKVDTAGLAWILSLVEQTTSAQCQLNLISFPDDLLKLATLCGVDSFLPIDLV